MVVKAKRGRRRYIAFTASPPSGLTHFAFTEVARKAKEMSGASEVKPIQHHGGIGIVRTSNLDQRRVTEALNSFDPVSPLGFGVKTVRASGTLRKLRDGLGVPRPPRERDRKAVPNAPKKR